MYRPSSVSGPRPLLLHPYYAHRPQTSHILRGYCFLLPSTTKPPCRDRSCCPDLTPTNHLWRWRCRSRPSPILERNALLVVMFWFRLWICRFRGGELGLVGCGLVGRGRSVTGPAGCISCGRRRECSGLRMLGRHLLCRCTRGVLFHLVSLHHRVRRLVLCLHWCNSPRGWVLCLHWRNCSRRWVLCLHWRDSS